MRRVISGIKISQQTELVFSIILLKVFELSTSIRGGEGNIGYISRDEVSLIDLGEYSEKLS